MWRRDGRTDGRTDGQTSCHGIVRAIHTRRAVKTEWLRREVYILPLCSAYPREPIVTPLCMWGLMGDVITRACTISAQPVQGLGSDGTHNFPISYTYRSWPLQTVSTTVIYCDACIIMPPTVGKGAISVAFVCPSVRPFYWWSNEMGLRFSKFWGISSRYGSPHKLL